MLCLSSSPSLPCAGTMPRLLQQPQLRKTLFPPMFPPETWLFPPLFTTFLDIFSCSYPTSWFLRENETCAHKQQYNGVCPREGMLLFSQLLVLQRCKTKQKTNPSVSTWSFYPPEMHKINSFPFYFLQWLCADHQPPSLARAGLNAPLLE